MNLASDVTRIRAQKAPIGFKMVKGRCRIMAINGCLTLAWLEEDDPSRGFFRVRPAAVISATPQAYVHGGEYGEDGFLRVVPDKNEMSTFKLRMRTLGKLCLIDPVSYTHLTLPTT